MTILDTMTKGAEMAGAHPHSQETPCYLGSVQARPYLFMLTDRRTGETRHETRGPTGRYNYWAYADGVYCQWQDDAGSEYGALRAYSSWSTWLSTGAALALYGDNGRDLTVAYAGSKVPASF